MSEEVRAIEVVEEQRTQAQEPAEPQSRSAQDDKKYSDKDVDAIIAKKFAQWQNKQEKNANRARQINKRTAREKQGPFIAKIANEITFHSRKGIAPSQVLTVHVVRITDKNHVRMSIDYMME